MSSAPPGGFAPRALMNAPIHFNYGTIWLADYDHHLVWRIKP